MQRAYLIGLEFEYWLTCYNNKTAEGVKSFENLSSVDLETVLNNRLGMEDTLLRRGD